MSKLNELKELLSSGAIDQKEYEILKNKIDNSSNSENTARPPINSSENEKNKLKELDDLLKSGAIDQREYEQLKSKIKGFSKEIKKFNTKDKTINLDKKPKNQDKKPKDQDKKPKDQDKKPKYKLIFICITVVLIGSILFYMNNNEKEDIELQSLSETLERDRPSEEVIPYAKEEPLQINVISELYTAIALSKRVYFWEYSNGAMNKSKSFIIRNDIITVLEIETNNQFSIGEIRSEYDYVRFVNKNSGKITEGWVLADQIDEEPEQINIIGELYTAIALSKRVYFWEYSNGIMNKSKSFIIKNDIITVLEIEDYEQFIVDEIFGEYDYVRFINENTRKITEGWVLSDQIMDFEEFMFQNNGIETKLFEINDPDGYSNLRETPGGNIIRRIYQGEKFEVLDEMNMHKKVKFPDGQIGYIHVSRVVESVEQSNNNPQEENESMNNSIPNVRFLGLMSGSINKSDALDVDSLEISNDFEINEFSLNVYNSGPISYRSKSNKLSSSMKAAMRKISNGGLLVFTNFIVKNNNNQVLNLDQSIVINLENKKQDVNYINKQNPPKVLFLGKRSGTIKKSNAIEIISLDVDDGFEVTEFMMYTYKNGSPFSLQSKSNMFTDIMIETIKKTPKGGSLIISKIKVEDYQGIIYDIEQPIVLRFI